MTLMPTRMTSPKTAKAKTNFRVAIRNNRQIAGCELKAANCHREPFPCCAGPFGRLASGRTQFLEMLRYGRNSNVRGLASRALNDFQHTFGNLLSHIDTKGDTHQVGVLELHPRPFVPIVQQNVVSGSLQLAGDVLGGGADGFIFSVGGNYDYLKRRDGWRQPESVLVVILLDGSGQDALDANPVAAHDGGDLLAVAVEHAGTHGFGILIAQLEDVSDLDGGIDAQGSPAVGAIFAGGDAAQVGGDGVLEVLAGSHVLEMVVELVGAADHVGAADERLVKQDMDGARIVFRIAGAFLPIPHSERFPGLYHQANRSDVTSGTLEVFLQF